MGINLAAVVWSTDVEKIKFFGAKLVDFGDFTELLCRFGLNTIMMFLIVRFLYLRYNQRRNFSFTYLAVGVVVFLLCYLLNNVKLELGFALGLFAIFGIIRYRTDTIPFKQMTYLFVVIGISVMNALANKKVSYAELVFTNLAIYAVIWLLEKYLTRKQEGSIRLVYENISNIHHDKYDVLLEDLKVRTGFNVKHFEILEIDYLKDVAVMMVYFNVNENSYTVEK